MSPHPYPTFVGFLVAALLSQDEPHLARVGADHMQNALSADGRSRTPHALAIDGDHLAQRRTYLADPFQQRQFEPLRIDRLEDTTDRVVARHAIAQPLIPAQSLFIRLAPGLHVIPPLGASK